MKKCLSLLLTAALLLSVFSVGTCAFAATAAEVSEKIRTFDMDALILTDSMTDLMDASAYPEEALAAVDALAADYGALSQEALNAMPLEDYISIVEILYQAKRWTDWDAAGRPTDMYLLLMFYLAWQDASSQKYADAARKLARVPEIQNTTKVRAFFDATVGAETPYTNAQIAAAKEAYAAVPAVAWSLLAAEAPDATEEAMETYRTMLAAIGPDEQTDNAVDLGVYQSADPGSVKISDKTLQRLLTVLSVLGIDTDEKLAALPQKAATGKTVVALMTRLAGVHPLLCSMISPALLAQGLAQDPKFSGAVEKCSALTEAGHTTLIETANDDTENPAVVWSADADPLVVFTSADFGFEDGDYYGFIDALGATLGSLGGLVGLLGPFRNEKDTSNGVYNYGKYEELLPLLELLDLPVLSSVAFTEAEAAMRFTDADGNEYEDSVRAGVNALLRPVADYLTGTFAAHPTQALLTLLPKLAYAVDAGLLQDAANALLASLAPFGLTVDLTTEGVWQIVDKKLVSSETNAEEDAAPARNADVGIDIDKDGEKEPLPLTHDVFVSLIKRLAYSARAVVKPSVSAHNKNRLGLEASQANTATALASTLEEILQTEAGKAFAEELFAGFGVSGVGGKLLKKLQNRLTAKGGVQKLVSLLGSPLFPIVVFFLRMAKLFDGLRGLFGTR